VVILRAASNDIEDVRPLLSGQYPLQDAVAAFAAAADKNKSTKVQVIAAPDGTRH